MKMTRDFCSGYAAAVADLGAEGDQRHVDWSAAFNYLKERLTTFEPVGDDLIERLHYRGHLEAEAADEIERLRAELQRIADEDSGIPGGIAWAALQFTADHSNDPAVVSRALEALGEKP